MLCVTPGGGVTVILELSSFILFVRDGDINSATVTSKSGKKRVELTDSVLLGKIRATTRCNQVLYSVNTSTLWQ